MNISASLYQTSNARSTRVLGFTCVYHFTASAQQDLTRTTQINTFHWHVVDSQSFPLIIPGFTDIAENGAYSSSSVYTPSDVADIISYAGAVRASRSLTRRFCRSLSYLHQQRGIDVLVVRSPSDPQGPAR
jgi:hypothetical protein